MHELKKNNIEISIYSKRIVINSTVFVGRRALSIELFLIIILAATRCVTRGILFAIHC